MVAKFLELKMNISLLEKEKNEKILETYGLQGITTS